MTSVGSYVTMVFPVPAERRNASASNALLQMRAETLTRINEALLLLDAGQYGSCVE
jgi:hypothetical protein